MADHGFSFTAACTSAATPSWIQLLTAAGAIAAALLSAVIVFWLLRGGGLRRRGLDTSQDLVRDTLDYLTGGAQKRTIGIALLEERVAEGRISKDTARFILESQERHLRDHGNPEAWRDIERFNLARIVALLEKWRGPQTGPVTPATPPAPPRRDPSERNGNRNFERSAWGEPDAN